MPELTITAQEITDALKRHVDSYTADVGAEQVGRIIEVGDGIARVSGLPRCAVNELLEFEDGDRRPRDEPRRRVDRRGRPRDRRPPRRRADRVSATGQILSIPVGDELLGRVVNPLGEPIDGKGPIDRPRPPPHRSPGPGHHRPPAGERATPDRHQSHRRHDPDRPGPAGADHRRPQDGQVHVAIDTIINQKGLGVKCIYVAVGQKASTVAQTVRILEEFGALEYTVVVASAGDPAPFKFLAPYAGCAMGQHWMDTGEHALIVYDDLSKQAEAYRQISLLLRRPPGREAYPGDVFYLHSRLLERSAKLSDELGGGSLTALPIIETKAGDISAYIPTNVISITDGQVYLLSDLFYSGVRPAIDVGNSVSRVAARPRPRP